MRERFTVCADDLRDAVEAAVCSAFGAHWELSAVAERRAPDVAAQVVEALRRRSLARAARAPSKGVGATSTRRRRAPRAPAVPVPRRCPG